MVKKALLSATALALSLAGPALAGKIYWTTGFGQTIERAKNLQESAWKPFSAHATPRTPRMAAHKRSRRKRERVRARKARERGDKTLATISQWAAQFDYTIRPGLAGSATVDAVVAPKSAIAPPQTDFSRLPTLANQAGVAYSGVSTAIQAPSGRWCRPVTMNRHRHTKATSPWTSEL